MIFVTDKGRMANNIYQYGQVYAWGREHGRATMSMRFAHKYPDFRIAHTRYHNTLVYLLAKLAARLHFIPVVDFSDGQTDKKVATIARHKHVLVTGWGIRFEVLFQKYKTDIIRLFDFLPHVRQQVAETLQASPTGTLKLGVHIRRGDYKTLQGGRFYYDDQQYIDTIRRFAEQHPDRQTDVYICTNDMQLDQSLYEQQLAPQRVFFPCGSPTEDLCLLSECDYLIGPLSSFTLIASMYRNTPLFWMMDDNISKMMPDDFHDFDYLLFQFDKYFAAYEP
jgi:hypothetical protein